MKNYLHWMRRKALLCTVMVGLLFVAGSSYAFTYDAASQFSATNNPSGVWSYGYTYALGGTFNLYPNTTLWSSGGIEGWVDNSIAQSGVPTVAYNPTGSSITQGTVTLLPGQMLFHPGPTTYSVVQFTAPSAGTYDVTAQFEKVDWDGRNYNTYVYVLENGTPLMGPTSVSGFEIPTSLFASGPLSLIAGNTIDFVVQAGDSGYLYNSTGISAQVSAVPVPPSMLLLAPGLLGLVGMRKRFFRS